MMKNKVQVGSEIYWKQYWRKTIKGTVKSLSYHNDKRIAKVTFADCPEIPYWVDVEELKFDV